MCGHIVGRDVVPHRTTVLHKYRYTTRSKTVKTYTQLTVMTGQRRVDPFAVKGLLDRGKGQTGKGRQAKPGISEAGQRRKQYQAEVGVTGTGSEFQGRAVRGQTQRSQLAGWITLRNVSRGKNKTSRWVHVRVLLKCVCVNEVQVWWDNQG